MLSAAIGVLLVALNLFVYRDVGRFDFVNWDDPSYLTDNAHVQAGLTLPNVWWALTTTHSPYWHPVTWLSHMLDVSMYGMNPGPHHITNLILHIANTLLLFAILNKMTRSPGPSAFVAAIFAVHPLHVESVAWLAERKDVLSTFLLMVTIWMYVRYVERPGAGRYTAVVVLYALALMAKTMVVTLPFALLLLDIWPLRRTSSPEHRRSAGEARVDGNERSAGGPAFECVSLRRAIVEKVPLLALAVVAGVATLIVQKQVGAVAGLAALPLRARVANSLAGYVIYVWKTVWPERLAPFYPFRTYSGWAIALAALALVAATLLAAACRARCPYVTVGWLWYIITLSPVIGLMQAGEQATADRFMYVPMIGLLFIAAWGGRDWLARSGLRSAVVAVVVVTLVVIAGAAARVQASYWADSLTLWQHAIAVTPPDPVPYEKLGDSYRDRAELQRARETYQIALRLAAPEASGERAMILNSLGLVFADEGNTAAASQSFGEAVRLNPAFVEAQNNAANALAGQGRFADAIGRYEAALRLMPDLAEARVGLGAALVSVGRPADAVPQYQEALKLNPSLAQAHSGLGAALSQLGHDADASRELTEALRLRPDLPSAHLNFAVLLARQGRLAEARQHLETALRIDPNYEPARRALAQLR